MASVVDMAPTLGPVPDRVRHVRVPPCPERGTPSLRPTHPGTPSLRHPPGAPRFTPSGGPARSGLLRANGSRGRFDNRAHSVRPAAGALGHSGVDHGAAPPAG